MAKGERELAGKLLELFGPYGEQFDPFMGDGKYCLVSGCTEVTGILNTYESLYPYLPEPFNSLAHFATGSDWLTIKSWLEGIRDGKEATDGR